METRFVENNQRITAWVHQKLSPLIHNGDSVIDATCGNGHDTLFLAKAVGNCGKVIAIDLQAQAIHSTQERLRSANVETPVEYYEMGHEKIEKKFENAEGFSTIFFNLGYLPSGDKNIITQATTTLQAINGALKVLSLGGNLSIMLYPGHSGGDTEATAVIEWAKLLSTDLYRVFHYKQKHSKKSPPEWLWIHRKEP